MFPYLLPETSWCSICQNLNVEMCQPTKKTLELNQQKHTITSISRHGPTFKTNLILLSTFYIHPFKSTLISYCFKRYLLQSIYGNPWNKIHRFASSLIHPEKKKKRVPLYDACSYLSFFRGILNIDYINTKTTEVSPGTLEALLAQFNFL